MPQAPSLPLLRRRTAAALLAAALLAPLARAPAATDAAREDWYQVTIGGSPAGWVVVRERAEDGEITTETEMELSLSREETELTVGLATRFVETAAGEPVSLWVSQAMGQVPVETSYRFAGDGVEVRTVQGEAVTEKTIPPPAGPWLPPAAAQRLVARRVAEGADEFVYRTIDPATGPIPVVVAGRRLADGEEVVLPDGSTVTTSVWSQTQEPGTGVESTLYLDGGGRMVRSSVPILGAEMVLTLADRQTARAAGGGPELLVRSFVRPSRPIPSPRSTRRAVYRLRGADGTPEPPSAGGQRVDGDGGGGTRITVTAGGSSPAAEEDPAPYLEPSTFLNYRDPAVAALAADALDGAPEEPEVRAELLRSFVHRTLTEKDLATGFATASEVAQRRSGDCTEHSVLLAALLRAARIPSRVVVGLLYVEAFAGEREIFGYHMWTQALLDGRWVDLDPLTPRPFDAAHIALATSALDDASGFTAVAAAVASRMGSLEIEVVEIEP